MAPELAHIPVTLDDLSKLRPRSVADSKTGYRGVYLHGRQGQLYRARFRISGRILNVPGCYHTPGQAARMLVRHLKVRMGDAWANNRYGGPNRSPKDKAKTLGHSPANSVADAELNLLRTSYNPTGFKGVHQSELVKAGVIYFVKYSIDGKVCYLNERWATAEACARAFVLWLKSNRPQVWALFVSKARESVPTRP